MTISLEAYFEFLIAGYLNISFNLKEKSGELTGYLTSFYSLAVAVIILPSLMIFVLTKPISTIQDELFRKKFGSLYEGMRVKTKLQVCANLFFMARRAAFVLVCFNIGTIPGVQLIVVNLINLVSCLYYGGVQPFETRFRRNLDFFNEYCILIITWHMMCFTDFILEMETQWLVGWSMIACISFNALVNIIIILAAGGKSIYLIGLKYYRILSFYFEKAIP